MKIRASDATEDIFVAGSVLQSGSFPASFDEAMILKVRNAVLLLSSPFDYRLDVYFEGAQLNRLSRYSASFYICYIAQHDTCMNM